MDEHQNKAQDAHGADDEEREPNPLRLTGRLETVEHCPLRVRVMRASKTKFDYGECSACGSKRIRVRLNMAEYYEAHERC